MICPHCKTATAHHVTDSRSGAYGTRRRRQCAACMKRFTTYETTAPPPDAQAARRELGTEIEKLAKAVKESLGKILATAIGPASEDRRPRRIDWGRQPLGEVADVRIAEKLDVSRQAVTLARNRRGIPRANGNGKNTTP